MNTYFFFSRQCFQSLPFFLLMPFWLLFTQKLHAGAIEVSIDPYNSSQNDYSVDFNTQNQIDHYSPSKSNLLNNENMPSGGIYYVKGNSTPTPPAIINGNLTTSNRSLPAIPPLSEPYSAQQSPNISSSNSSNLDNFSVSSFDATPVEETSFSVNVSPQITTNGSSNSNNNGVRRINLSPNNRETMGVMESVNPSDKNDLGKRKNLRDVLVFSQPSNPIPPQNNGSNLLSVSTSPSVINRAKVYKVLAQINNNQQETGVKSLYPEAFKTNYQGKSLLQVGVFSNRESAEQVSQSLMNIGVRPIILP